MKLRTLVLFILIGLLFSACGQNEDSVSMVQTSVASTTIAGQTMTASLLETAAAMQTKLAPTATDIFTATSPFTDTPLPSDTPFPTNTLAPTLTPTVSAAGGGSPTGCAVQCTGGGCHNIKVNNKTNENAYLTLEGPGNYCFTVPPGVGYKYWILPGYYKITIEKCGGEVITFSNQLNSGWYFDIKC